MAPSKRARKLGAVVWGIDHVRTSILSHLRHLYGGKPGTLLTLNRATYSSVVEVLYRNLPFAFYLQRTAYLGPFIPDDRRNLYKNSVRHIDFTGALPLCSMFPGGFPTLILAFPLLRSIQCSTLSATRREAPEGSDFDNLCVVSKAIPLFLGRWKGSYEHHLPPTWQVTVEYDITLDHGSSLWYTLSQPTSPNGLGPRPPRPFKLPINNLVWNVEGVDSLGSLPLEYIAKQRENRLLPPIPNISIVDSPFHWQAFQELPEWIGQCHSLQLSVALVHDFRSNADAVMIDDEGEDSEDEDRYEELAFEERYNSGVHWLEEVGGGSANTLADLLCDFNWSRYSALKILNVTADCFVDDFLGMKNLPYRLGEVDHKLPPPIYSGPCLNLESFTFTISMAFRDNSQYTYGPDSDGICAVGCTPSPEYIAKSLIAIGGLGCVYQVQLELCSAVGAASTFKYLVHKEINNLKDGYEAGWYKGAPAATGTPTAALPPSAPATNSDPTILVPASSPMPAAQHGSTSPLYPPPSPMRSLQPPGINATVTAQNGSGSSSSPDAPLGPLTAHPITSTSAGGGSPSAGTGMANAAAPSSTTTALASPSPPKKRKSEFEEGA